MNNLAQQVQRQKEQQQVVHTKVKHRLRGKVTKGEKVIMSGMIAGVIAVSSLIVTNYANIYSQEREISSLQNTVSQQQEINDGLHLQVAELSSPDRIMYYAKEELGMQLKEEKVRVVQN
ncbi:cell division protein FtsL [Bacillus sp. FJAT-44742]|uniref:cell division protein FtsL n=1 Tax=Bacillus sp. FJAT-44742 TaxID=2014005 RepID=UPI000C2466F4|nr:cell division protein FtsL [Bacillus sp. FJAT-44742]